VSARLVAACYRTPPGAFSRHVFFLRGNPQNLSSYLFSLSLPQRPTSLLLPKQIPSSPSEGPFSTHQCWCYLRIVVLSLTDHVIVFFSCPPPSFSPSLPAVDGFFPFSFPTHCDVPGASESLMAPHPRFAGFVGFQALAHPVLPFCFSGPFFPSLLLKDSFFHWGVE